MAQIVVHAIVTRYVNYRDNDRILTLFTQERGRVDASARGCRRPKSPLLACSQPFVFGEFQLYEAKGRFSVNQCDVRETFYPIREDIRTMQAAFAAVALAQQAVQENEANEKLFILLHRTLTFLAYSEADAVDMALCFLIRYLDVLGICPMITSCALCNRDMRSLTSIHFSPASGGAICSNCASVRGVTGRISPLALEAMRRMLLLDETQLGKVQLTPALRTELYQYLSSYANYHLERENKQLAALKGLLQN